jgi:hypothetical protein
MDHDLLQTLLSECETQLQLLDAMRDSELRKPVLARSPTVLTFVDKEHSVYTFGQRLLMRLRDAQR